MVQIDVLISVEGMEPADHVISQNAQGPDSSLDVPNSSGRLSSPQVGCTPAFLWDIDGVHQVHTALTWHP